MILGIAAKSQRMKKTLEYFSKVHNTEYSLPKGGLNLSGDPLNYFLTGRYSKEVMSSPVFIRGHPIDIIGKYAFDLFSENRNGRRTDNLYDSRILFLAEDTRNNNSEDNRVKFEHNSCRDKRICMRFEVYYENGLLLIKDDFLSRMPKFIEPITDLKKLKKKAGFLDELIEYEHELNLSREMSKELVDYLF